jgi:hypothetical protein
MTASPLYVIVHHRADRNDRTVVYDCHPDRSLADVTERAASLQSHVAGYGRPDDTYRVAELRFTDEEER